MIYINIECVCQLIRNIMDGLMIDVLLMNVNHIVNEI